MKKEFVIVDAMKIKIIFMLLLLLFVGCDDSPNPQKYLRGENTARITILVLLHEYTSYYSAEAGKKPISLFDVIDYSIKNNRKPPYSITLPYKDDKDTEDSYFVRDFLKSEEEFDKKCDYKVVNIDNKKWGILELGYCRFGKYYFLITEDEKVYRIHDNKYLDMFNIRKNVFPLVELSKMIEAKKASTKFPLLSPPPRDANRPLPPYPQGENLEKIMISVYERDKAKEEKKDRRD